MEQGINKTLRVFQTEINSAMEAYFEGQAINNLPTHSKQALEFLRDFSKRPGKRIRGALAMTGYKMFGGSDNKAALDLAVAIELIQNYLLIIDDVMDRSISRRGEPTVHEQYLAELEKDLSESEARHLSNMLGISVGVVAQHLAAELLSSLDVAPDRLQKAQQLFQANILATCYGQIEDLFNSKERKIDEKSIIEIYTLKNSYYTFINPLQIGATLAGADEKALRAIKNFGIHAGVAFQLQDDVIGMFGDEKKTGKSSMDDLREGKMTVLIHHALDSTDKTQSQTILKALGNKDLTSEYHREVKNILESLGSRGYVSSMAKREAQKASQLLDVFGESEEKKFLQNLLVFIIERES